MSNCNVISVDPDLPNISIFEMFDMVERYCDRIIYFIENGMVKRGMTGKISFLLRDSFDYEEIAAQIEISVQDDKGATRNIGIDDIFFSADKAFDFLTVFSNK